MYTWLQTLGNSDAGDLSVLASFLVTVTKAPNENNLEEEKLLQLLSKPQHCPTQILSHQHIIKDYFSALFITKNNYNNNLHPSQPVTGEGLNNWQQGHPTEYSAATERLV